MTSVSVKKRIALAVAAAAVLIAGWGVVSYATGAPPFGGRGTIGAKDVCESLGDPEEAAGLLNRLLPDSSEYSFSDHLTASPRTGHDTNFDTSCFINGDDGRLMSVRTELRAGETLDQWQTEVRENYDEPERNVKAFDAGRRAFSGRRLAAINSACVPEDEIPFGPYRLSTTVALQYTVPDDRVADLRRLAELAAEKAHGDARCAVAAEGGSAR
ncbi:hypothetical protein NX801_02865 [Streptomyces sp. LP05-1]|uniref:Secreted protein n=1 Tax=Streptomyces pyxinae TaxID=2970734 RepID=A0ABT2CB45_9ACTN|nr:hypothetical protein [Streptomyces sp. LP05-1]MCS0634617.1 hypothetical protein [Streptomyces sp. LP05-1]